MCPVHGAQPNCGWPTNDLPDIDGYEADDPKATFETVDRLLYEAKEKGRSHGLHLDVTSGTTRRIAPAGAPGMVP